MSTNKLTSYKSEIPQLQKIKRDLKQQCYDSKQQLLNIKSAMLGSNGLAAREAIIQDIQSLKEQLKHLESELTDLTENNE